MKKIIYTLLFSSLSHFLIAQTKSSDSTKSKLNIRPYVSIGLSISHVDPNDKNINSFDKASFPSIEAGIMGENISLGAVFGYESFVTSNARKFYELKTSVSKSLGKCSVYGLLGAGAYFEKTFNPFIEYGGGFSYMPNKLGYYVQYSNWARTNYVSVGGMYAF